MDLNIDWNRVAMTSSNDWYSNQDDLLVGKIEELRLNYNKELRDLEWRRIGLMARSIVSFSSNNK